MKPEKRKLNIGHSISGDEIAVPYYRIKGEKETPSLYVQGGVHGGETTYFVFSELIKQLRKIKILGDITLVPISNPFAWMQRLYYYTAGKFSLYDGKDFNRNFPGSKEGTSAERLAQKLSDLADKSQFSIDLHTANRSRPYLIVPSKEYLSIARAADIPYTWLVDIEELTKKGGGMCFTAGQIKRGQRSIAFECGSHDVFNQTDIQRVTKGLLNVFSYLTLIDFPRKTSGNNYYFTKTKKYLAPTSGFVEYLVSFEKEFKKGQPIYRLYPSNNLLETLTVKAEEDGVLLLHSDTHIVWEGDYVVEIAPKENIKKL